MPSVDDWTKQIRGRVGGHPREFATAADLREVEQAIREHPASAALWILRGDLIQLCDDILDDYPLEEALRSYQRASRLAPDDPEPQIEMGHYLDAIADDPGGAVPHFRAAIELGGGEAATKGLADAVAQLDHRTKLDDADTD